MPTSWPARLLSGPTTPPAVDPPKRSPIKPAGNLAPLDEHSDAAPKQNHNRSSSHPLPRLISKRAGSFSYNKRPNVEDDFEDGTTKVPDGLLGSSPANKSSGKRIGNEDYQMSPCMCCGQKSKFPRDTSTFRCTQCLTINDLRPMRLRARVPEKQPGEASDKNQREPPVERPNIPVSVERTRAIIDFCLTTYLRSRLQTKSADQNSREDRPKDDVTPTRPGLPPRASSKEANVHTVSSSKAIPASASEISGTPLSASIKSANDFHWTSYSAQGEVPTDQRLASSSTDSRRPPGVTRKPLPGIAAGPGALGRSPPSAAPLRSSPQNTQQIPSRGKPNTANVTARPPATARPTERITHERYDKAKTIFKPLEDYMLHHYGQFDCLNASFNTSTIPLKGRTLSESSIQSIPPEPMDGSPLPSHDSYPQIDAKTLLLGDFAENGDWWTGRAARNTSGRTNRNGDRGAENRKGITSKSPCIDWLKLDQWHDLVKTPNRLWPEKYNQLSLEHIPGGPPIALDADLKADIELDLTIARDHVERLLLKVMEQLLRRPGRPLKDPEDVRFLLLIISHPVLYPYHIQQRRSSGRGSRADQTNPRRPSNPSRPGRDLQHAGIIKRTLGLIAGSTETCHRHLITWFSRMPEKRFLDLCDLLSAFVSYRLSRRKTVAKTNDGIDDGGLIPDLTGSALQTSTQLQTAAGLSGGVKINNDDKESGSVDYTEDWQLRAAARTMALLFAANNCWSKDRTKELDEGNDARPRSTLHGQLLPVADFYNSMLDYQDVIADFKTWESKKGKFAFCQYPFFLSMGAKMRILGYDARRQQDTMARETYFNNVISGRAQDINFHLHVRRDCVVEDSLQRIGEAVGQMQGDLKKSLKVHFAGEEGVDAGGLRKEWFMLLVRDIFDANHGMFLYDDESHLCYFNPNSFETSDQYYMVGVLFGLAIYNSIILDVALPPFAFRKLMAAAPSSGPAKAPITYTLDDLAEYRPRLAAGLRTLLTYEGDVESTYCWTFTAPSDRYGAVTEVPLCPSGATKAVTNANRQEFVSLYVRHALDTSVARQFEPFKRGFFTVCAGNALSLFRAEEIELLIRGSAADAAIDVDALRAVAVYENFRAGDGQLVKNDVEAHVPVVRWFWEYFRDAQPRDQRRLLQFITASDRIPATGAAGLVLRVVGGGDGTGTGVGENERFPVARTCFNLVTLWGWRTKERLVDRIKGAVEGSEGFGLK